MHLFLHSAFRTEMWKMVKRDSLYVATFEMTLMATGAGRVWYHRLCRQRSYSTCNPRYSAAFFSFSSLTPAILPFTFWFNLHFTCILKLLL